VSVKVHENVRVQVSHLLRELLKEVVEQRLKISKDLYSFTLLGLLNSPEVTILMPQEVRVGGERKYIDMALGREIVFEFKSEEREFDEGAYDAATKYWQVVSKAKFFIITNWSKWRIYEVTSSGLNLVEACDRPRAAELLKTQIIPQLKEIKVPPLPQNVEALYKLNYEEMYKNLYEVFGVVRDDPRVKPLYEAYKEIMRMLYGEASEDFFIDLFIRHTYMHMAVLASLASALGVTGDLERVCSGTFLGIDIALPYLNWWRIALSNESLRGKLEGVLVNVVGRSRLIDWSLGAEDVFRKLYEFLVEPETRRRIGEYYTPLWLVEMMVSEFDIVKRVVLDPFCGSGTFLVVVFHEKIDRGESPEEALSEVVGFDINPLAVAVARAELVIAYWRRAGKAPEDPPHVYHMDSLAMWFRGPLLPGPSLRLMSKADYLHVQLLGQTACKSAAEILSTLRTLEKSLTHAIRFAYNDCKADAKCLERRMAEYLEKDLKAVQDAFIQNFLEHFRRDSVAKTVAELILAHGGNDVWAVVLTSVYAATLLMGFRPDIIFTNPPWVPVTEYKAPYIEQIRRYLRDRIEAVVGERAASVLAGADVALAALGKSVEIAREGVAYVMNREQLFYHKSPMTAGVLAAYSILKRVLRNAGAKMKLYDFDFDVFEHGIYPAVVIVKRG
jgi:hypothetical protein